VREHQESLARLTSLTSECIHQPIRAEAASARRLAFWTVQAAGRRDAVMPHRWNAPMIHVRMPEDL
jgi:hypothetical protein